MVMKMNNVNNLSKSENVRFFGRTARIESFDAVWFNWSGSGFVFSFYGTRAVCHLYSAVNGENVPPPESRAFIGVYIDDVPYQTARFELKQNSEWITLAEELPMGRHTVYVIKETEVAYGRAAVGEISVDGELLPPPPPPKLKLEFIGDSITCGYGNICSNASPDFVTREENFSQTYAAISSRMLGAELSVVAASGNGFFHDYGCNSHNLIPELYTYTDKFLHEHYGMLPEEWDFSADRCDAVIVKLGANDYQYCSGADLSEEQRSSETLSQRKKEFCGVASDFLRQITLYRPNTPVLLVYETDTGLKNELIEAVKIANCGIHTLEISPKREREGVGANGHYSVCTHARVAAEVANAIKKLL